MSTTGKVTLSCLDIANYFLVLVDREAGDTITQLKLQKLIYFAQGVSLALLEKPLFQEAIEAWDHGPVVKDLRKVFGCLKDGPIPVPGEIDFDIYTNQQKQLIYKVYTTYGEHTAYYLRNLTHTHSIWKEARQNQNELQVINQCEIKKFFKTQICDNFLSITKEDILNIENAEDQWWINYDCGISSHDATNEILESLQELKTGKGIGNHLVQ